MSDPRHAAIKSTKQMQLVYMLLNYTHVVFLSVLDSHAYSQRMCFVYFTGLNGQETGSRVLLIYVRFHSSC